MSDSPKLRKFLRVSDVEAAIGKKKSWLYKAVADGEFPRPIKLGTSTVVWDADEVAVWQQARVDERDRA